MVRPPIQDVRGRQAVAKSLFVKILRNHRTTVSDSAIPAIHPMAEPSSSKKHTKICLFRPDRRNRAWRAAFTEHRTNHEEIGMRTLGIGIAAAITLAAAVAPANAQGLWIGAPGFGVGIGVGPTPYYGGYRVGPYWGAGYDYEPSYAYQDYAYEPEYSYDSYAYVPDDGYVAYSYGPRLRTYAYDSGDSYGYAPRLRYSRNYAGDRATRTYPTTLGV